MKRLLKLFALLPFTFATAWAGTDQLPDGYYHFEGKWIYSGICHITHTKKDSHKVQCLEGRKYTFCVTAKSSGSFKIEKSDVALGKIKRNMSGSGELSKPGHASGKGSVWTKSLGIFSRDHRKGPWTLRPATAEEAASE